MGLIVSIGLLFISLMIFIIRKDIVHPGLLLCVQWAIICFFSQLRLFGLFAVDSKIWMIIFVGCISFVIGVFVAENIKVVFGNKGSCSTKDRESFIWSEKTHKVVFIVLLFLQFSVAVSAIQLLLSGEKISTIRSAFYGYTELEGYKNSLISGPIGTYIIYVQDLLSTLMITLDVYLYVKKARKKYLIEAIILVGLSVLINGGRYVILYVVIDLFICLNRGRKKGSSYLSLKIIRKVKLLLIVGLLVLAIFTVWRGSALNDVAKSFYTYICGSVVLADLHLQRVESLGFYAYGFASLYGITSFWLPILHFFGLPYPSIYLETNEVVMRGQDWLNIGNDMYSNAMLTAFYYLYADFRWVGIVIGMFLFGYIMGRLYHSFLVHGQNRHLIFYSIGCHAIFSTIQNYPFVNILYVLLIVFGVLSSTKFVVIKKECFNRGY